MWDFCYFPKKTFIERRVKLMLYLKPLFWFGVLVYFWFQWISIVKMHNKALNMTNNNVSNEYLFLPWVFNK